MPSYQWTNYIGEPIYIGICLPITVTSSCISSTVCNRSVFYYNHPWDNGLNMKELYKLRIDIGAFDPAITRKKQRSLSVLLWEQIVNKEGRLDNGIDKYNYSAV